MFVVPKHDREWIVWIKEEVAQRRLPCMAGCGDPATKIKFQGKRTGGFCGACFGELFWGNIPSLDRPKGLKRAKRR